ncbi:glycosyltransferase [Gordonia sp. L191]|uniref:glycosyltransferase n=1 Tax=Gordonia sp. L191 TaxID=2982699 RepID=UPI0024BF6130|nr:glycosyltransferase [Gordonia sp. L191]WHU47108.1 glycosyltransferase [Gordonia sp. L191]
MADILIAAYGSRGDIMPLTDIGCRLRDAGHHVVLTTNTDLADEVRACGLDAKPVDFYIDSAIDPDSTDPRKLAMQMVKPAGMRQLGRNLLAAVDDVPADIVLLTPFAELAGHPLAEARGIPSVGLRLQPLSATGSYPPSLLGTSSAGKFVNRAVGRSAGRWFDRIYRGVLADLRTDLGLPRRSARSLRNARTAAQWPILHGYSPNVLPRPADWRPGLEITGYWWPRRSSEWVPDADLRTFLESGAPPVYVGFGSLMLPPDEAADLSALVHRAVTTAGVRAVVQSGGTDLESSDDERIFSVGPVPHEWLFPRVSLAVHSCGAGTVAATLRAGIPSVGVPSPGGDQPFWARHLQQLGASAATLPRPRLDADRLAAAIGETLEKSRYRDAAAQLGLEISREDGAGRVVEAVEGLLDPRPR